MFQFLRETLDINIRLRLNLSNFHPRSSNALLRMIYFEENDSFSMRETQQ